MNCDNPNGPCACGAWHTKGDLLISSERDLKAEDYPRLYELYYMNDDTPRLSGREYLVHGYKEGWDQALQSSEVTKLREENTRLREALEFYSDLTEDGLDWNRVNNPACIQDNGKHAREALEKVK